MIEILIIKLQSIYVKMFNRLDKKYVELDLVEDIEYFIVQINRLRNCSLYAIKDINKLIQVLTSSISILESVYKNNDDEVSLTWISDYPLLLKEKLDLLIDD